MEEAAAWLTERGHKTAKSSLNTKRSRGGGPRFIENGRRRFYRESALREYLLSKISGELYLCEQIRDHGLADSNHAFTHNVMFPLIGMIHDENDLTIEEAQECFLEAICGGARYGAPGRGLAMAMRSWRSHRPEMHRYGKPKSLGSLIHFCKENGIDIPWVSKAELHDPAKHDPQLEC